MHLQSEVTDQNDVMSLVVRYRVLSVQRRNPSPNAANSSNVPDPTEVNADNTASNTRNQSITPRPAAQSTSPNYWPEIQRDPNGQVPREGIVIIPIRRHRCNRCRRCHRRTDAFSRMVHWTFSVTPRAQRCRVRGRHIDCSICQGTWENPQQVTTLRCLHVFCSSCVRNLVRSGDLRCPVCRTAI